jgi:hypothetical protein
MTPEERAELIADIASAIRIRNTDAGLSEEEQRWVKMAIQKEAQSIELRKAIIEKTLSGLVWMVLLGIGSMFLSWAAQHGYKP